MIRFAAVLLLFASIATVAQEKGARPEDVSSIEALMKVYYENISGPAGKQRDWDRDRTLFVPGAKLVAMHVDKNGAIQAEVMSHEEYVKRSGPLVTEGFFESEIHRVEKRFGNIAHVFSTYESRRTEDGPVIARGVNSLQLYWDGKRWWIVSNTWDGERKDNPIPKDLLP